MKKLILLSAVVAMFSQSCKDKDNDPKPSTPILSARQQALIGKDWKIKSVVEDGIDVTPDIPECIKDNVFFHFTNSSNGYGDEGQSKCDPSDSQRIVFTWKLINNENTMIVDSYDAKDTFNLLSVSTTEIKATIDETVVTFKNP